MALVIRPLALPEIPRLVEINPTFRAETVIRVERTGKAPWQGWRFYEDPLVTPFDKKDGYEFDAIERAHIAERHQAAQGLLEVIEDTAQQKLVGVLDVATEEWRRTAWLWNLMLDVSLRGQGWGRTLFERAITWAKNRQLRALMLETQSNNPLACHFYAHLGCQLVGVHDVFYTNHDLADNEVALFWSYPLA